MLARFVLVSCIVLGSASALASTLRASPTVIEIPIHGTIDEGMAHLVQRAVAQAEQEGAAGIVLDVNTPGGLVSAATEIRDAIIDTRVPTLAYVSERAWSAGALVTLSARRVAMSPASSIGAAEPIPHTVKTISALRGEFQATAARNHRDARLAGGMVDKSLVYAPYKRAGEILTLTADDAKRTKIADTIDLTLADALRDNGMAGVTVRTAEYTFGEQLARFATSPEVSGLLLTIGMLGLLIEMQTLHGIAGVIGVGAFALFFGTHVYAGFSNGAVIVLAVLGVVAILYELHVVPGHGVPGILGGGALFVAILLAFGVASFFIALQAVAMAIVLSALFFWFATKIFPQNAFMQRMTFSGVQGPDYVSSRDNSALLGQIGTAVSFLRPAGVASVAGRRVDVLTEGDFIPAGAPIRVSRVEGARVFVQPHAS